MVSRSGSRARPSGANSFELASWYFFRISGLVLLVMAIMHTTIMHLINMVDQIDYQFIADRWHSPFWKVFDVLLLFFSLLHGLNGARLSIDDYIRRPGWRIAAHTTLWLIAVVFLVVGTMAVITFDPDAASAAQAAAGR